MSGGVRRTLVAAGLITGLAAASWPVAGDLMNRPVLSVRIAGEFQHVAREALEQAVLTELGGSRFFQVDVEAVRRAAQALPWVREVAVRRVWPDSLHIAVVERVAVARWNAAALLEDDASVFTPARPVKRDDLVRLEGPQGSQAEVLGAYMRLAPGLANLAGGITRLSLSSRGQWELEFGSGLSLVPAAPLDAPEVVRFANSLPAVLGGDLERAARIDLRYANGFAVRWRAVDTQPEGSKG